MYGAECWTVRKKEEHILEKTEMRMLRRIKRVTLWDKVKSVDIRKELGVTSIQEKLREMRLHWYGHMQRMEENNEEREQLLTWECQEKIKGETKREMDELRPKGYAGTADHPRWCPGQNILEINNSGRWPHLVGKGEEEEVVMKKHCTVWSELIVCWKSQWYYSNLSDVCSGSGIWLYSTVGQHVI